MFECFTTWCVAPPFYNRILALMGWGQEGQRELGIFPHPPGSFGRRLGFRVSLQDTMAAGVLDRRSETIRLSCCNRCANQLWKRRVWDSSTGLREVFVRDRQRWQVRTPVQNSSFWSLPINVREHQVCSCGGGKGAHGERKALVHGAKHRRPDKIEQRSDLFPTLLRWSKATSIDWRRTGYECSIRLSSLSAALWGTQPDLDLKHQEFSQRSQGLSDMEN